MRPAALLVIFLLACAGRAAAQGGYDYDNLAFRGVGAFAFSVVPARSEATVGLQLRGDLGLLGPQVRIAPSVTFWTTRLQQEEVGRVARRLEALCEADGASCPGIELGEVRLSDLSLDMDAHYLWTTAFGIEPYAGLGAGLHLVNGGGEFIDDTFVEDILDAITPGLNAMAGIELPLGRSLRLHGEVRAVLAGGANWIGAGVGGTFTFPTPRPQAAGGRP
ncbi:MAG TPA: hypothetical protein VF625_07850 [Longimicrobium sp.]